jgi:hypothetical protein
MRFLSEHSVWGKVELNANAPKVIGKHRQIEAVYLDMRVPLGVTFAPSYFVDRCCGLVGINDLAPVGDLDNATTAVMFQVV